MKTTFAAALLAGLLALSPILGAPPESKPPENKPTEKEPVKNEKPIVVPFELLKSRHMAIQVKNNDKGPYRLIFDTGAPMNLINNRIAKDSGVMTKNDKGGLSLFGAMGAKPMKKFEVGGIVLEGMQTMVVDHPTVAALAEVVGPVEGLVGFPFFARYKMTIDYQKKEMSLVPNDYKPGDTMQLMMDKLMGGAGGKKPEPTIVAPAAVWGFTVDKNKYDEDDGVAVTEVLEKSPAALGGLKVGDRLLTLDGRWTDSIGDTFFAASTVKPGQKVTLVVKRAGKEVKLTVTPGKGL